MSIEEEWMNTNMTLCVLWGATNKTLQVMTYVYLFISVSFLFLHPFYLSVPHYSIIHLHISTYQTGLLIPPKYVSSNGRQQSPSYYHQRVHSPAEHSLAATASLLHLFDMKLHIVSLTILISFKNNKKTTFSISNLRKQINQRRVNCLQ